MNTEVPIADAVRSYLFNSQLVTMPDGLNGADLPDRMPRNPQQPRDVPRSTHHRRQSH